MVATFMIIQLLMLASVALAHEAGPTEILLDLPAVCHVSTEPADVEAASVDFGMTAAAAPTPPLAVVRPSSGNDVARVVRAAYGSSGRLAVSARGRGHSVGGQAHPVRPGVVVEMSGPGAGINLFPPQVSREGMYVDAWGGALWIDVLAATLGHGLSPVSWTDYLYLSIGGTLSVGGISGQAFHRGPQINIVLELDVVTGKGDQVTCSQEQNQELFHAVLGGLGQFGIITRARIALETAPTRVRWIRVLYSDFVDFTKDQEYLISLHEEPSSKRFDYVEGFVIVDEGLVNNWRSSFFSPSNPIKIASFSVNGAKNNVLYCLEITRNYDESDSSTIDQEVEAILKRLNFIPSSVFKTDVAYVDFLDRVHKAELKLRSKGLWHVPHPWLNLFVPRSRIVDFDRGVFKGILGNKTNGPILVYPMNKNKWDPRTSAVTPDEEVFYLVALLRSASGDQSGDGSLDRLRDQNRRILEFCGDEGIGAKQYMPRYSSRQEWIEHFGQDKWALFGRRKAQFDPRRILATGQGIVFDDQTTSFDDHEASEVAYSSS